ncbi:Importin beta-related nuclear transport receptor [Ceratocystis lukuohia]|uniref:Importin beta-related nuclear transport receptor n=1 Tax=Ceratocystis lukuohia TaxID=2019550 RepID=A0ABR4MLF5_9PEZI
MAQTTTDNTSGGLSQMEYAMEELNELKLAIETKLDCQAIEKKEQQEEEEASRARASRVTGTTLTENRWSFFVPDYAILSRKVGWPVWFQIINSSLVEIDLEIRDIKYLDRATHARMLRLLRETVSQELQMKIQFCDGFDEAIDILQRSSMAWMKYAEIKYLEKLRSFDFLLDETMPQMLVRYSKLIDEGELLGIGCDDKSKIMNLRQVVIDKYPELLLVLITRTSWLDFFETVRFESSLEKYEVPPVI